MEGYVSQGMSSRYAQLLGTLESTSLSAWSGGKVSFFKFGTSVSRIPAREHLLAVGAQFYQDLTINRETNIQNVLEKEDGKALTLIVTDLFQSQADVSLLVDKIKSRVLAHNLSVGILAVRSQFEGVIYDIDVLHNSLPYQAVSNPSQYRPFYVLMLGKHGDIARYFEYLQYKHLPFISEKDFLLVSQHINIPPAFSSARLAKASGIKEYSSRLCEVPRDGTIDPRIRQVGIRTDEAYFCYEIPCTRLPHTMDYDSKGLQFNLCMERFDRKSRSFSISPESLASCSVNPLEHKDQTILFSGKLRRKGLDPGTIYRLHLTATPRPDSWKYPQWMQEWTMGTRIDGSRTVNLDNFISSLWLAATQIEEPKVLDLYLYMQCQ